MADPGALLVGDRRTLGEVGAAGLGRVDADCREDPESVEDRSHGAVDKDEVAVGAGARRHRPHHIGREVRVNRKLANFGLRTAVLLPGRPTGLAAHNGQLPSVQ